MKIQPTLSPTAAPVPFGGIVSGLAALLCPRSRTERLKQELREALQVEHVFLVSSGKAALALILLGLQQLSPKRKVVIPAYTCFSVPSAVVKAELEVVLCDVNPMTLDFDRAQLERVLDDRTLCVLPTHLFGLPVEMEHVRALCRARGITVIEDAAQAMGGVSEQGWLGTTGDVGFYSLGRGKNISSGGGGIIVTNSAVVAQAIQTEYDTLPIESRWSAVKNLLELLATRVLIHPRWYWLPAGLPFLGLGETRFYPNFPIERMAEARAATLSGWRERLEASNRSRREQASSYLEELHRSGSEARAVTAREASYLRLPVLLRDRSAKQAFCGRAIALGLGVSPGYPSTIQHIPELQGRLAPGEYPGATEVVDRLVTLPTHRFVRPLDRTRICRVLEEASLDSGREVVEDGTSAHRSVVKAASGG